MIVALLLDMNVAHTHYTQNTKKETLTIKPSLQARRHVAASPRKAEMISAETDLIILRPMILSTRVRYSSN